MSILLLYSRYVPFDVETALKKGFPLRGETPFDVKGDISVKENGDFHCEVTGLKGSKEDFLKKPFPHLTQAGIEKAVEFESKDEPELNNERFESELTHFQSKKGESDEFENMCGIAPSEVEGAALWYNAKSNQLHYAQQSVTGHPICRFSWKPGTRNELIFGVPRVSVPENGKQLWFVEDHLQAVILRKHVDDPVLVRPCEAALQWNDYEKVVAGREVICLQGDDVGEYEYTSYPLINAVSPKAKTWTNVYYPPLTSGVPFVRWLTSSEINVAKLFEEIKQSSGKATQAITKQVYNSFIGNDLHKRLHFPQDTGGGMLWYGTVEGNLVHSVPVNKMDPDEVLNKKNLVVDAGELNQIQMDGIRLNDSEVMNIHTSHGQLKPKRVFNQLKGLIDRHVYFSNKHLSSLVALWIIGGYVYKLFPAYSYLRLNGLNDTGKTTLLKIISDCGFNGTIQSQITKAGLAETVHYLSCTLCLDEAEEKSVSSKDEYVQLLKAGYRSDGSYSKVSGKNVRSLSVYCPKAIASIDPLGDEALDSRTLTINTFAKPQGISLMNWDMNVGDTAKEVTLIRRGCYTFGLWHHKAIERLYRKIPSSIQLPSGMILENRKRQIVAPLLAVAQLIDTNGLSDAEDSLLKALDTIWNPDYKEVEKSTELLFEQLSEWGQEPSFTAYDVKVDMLYMPNELWNGTPLEKDLGGKNKTLEWFNSLQGVSKEAVHIPGTGTKSCTGFPMDLNVHKKTVREIFSSKKGVK
jgi:hypothetical protein